ncbi:MAG: 7-carboxy-7-deazaguanine synthase QueE [Deltaproteobacteria bacterium]|nr:7-carboxy-7-deazaguanine synthase QueE [Deltaproteobacteria bacterium]
MKIAKLNGRPEIFYSVQGEGRNIGQPRVFIRSSLCNLKCTWCDTAYTWNWKKFKKEDEIVDITPQMIAEEVQRHRCKNLVFTGGEPLLQQESWVEIMGHLRGINARYYFEVETNGTFLPSDEFDLLINQYNVSPKLENSDNSQASREKKTAYSFFAESPKAFFKYVVVDEKDLDEILKLIGKYNISSDHIYLMPEGTTSKQLKAKSPWIKKICKTHGFHFSDRSHIHLYGSMRGV